MSTFDSFCVANKHSFIKVLYENKVSWAVLKTWVELLYTREQWCNAERFEFKEQG